MVLDDTYFDYPHRSYGMDHDWYDWSMLVDRKPVEWPDGKQLAVWINVALQYFPLNQKGEPFPPPGGMTTAYPDLRHYTLRDYGNRVGIFRILKALDRFDVRASFSMNARVAERYPYLVRRVVDRGDEIICHGWDMDTPHYGGQGRDDESAVIARSLEVLRDASGQSVEGWLSPGKSQSTNTAELLVSHGVRLHVRLDQRRYAISVSHPGGAYHRDAVVDRTGRPFHYREQPALRSRVRRSDHRRVRLSVSGGRRAGRTDVSAKRSSLDAWAAAPNRSIRAGASPYYEAQPGVVGASGQDLRNAWNAAQTANP